MSVIDYNQRYQGLNTKLFQKKLAKQALPREVIEARNEAGSLLGKIGKKISRKHRELISVKKSLERNLNQINSDIKRNSKALFFLIPIRILSEIFGRMSGLSGSLAETKKLNEKYLKSINDKIAELLALISTEDSNEASLMLARNFYDQGEYKISKAIAEKLLPKVLDKIKECNELINFHNPKKD